MNRILRFLSTAGCIVLLAAVLPGTVQLVKSLLGGDIPRTTVVFCAAGLIGLVAFSTRPLQFLHVFLHECGHAVMSMVYGHGVSEFFVSSSGNGYVRTSQSNILVSLAPYSISFSPMVLLTGASIVRPEVALVFVGLSGFLFGDHLVSVVRDFRPHQTDVTQHGLLVSFCLMTLLNIISLSLVVLLLSGAPVSGFTGFFAGAGQRIVGGAKVVFGLFS